MRTGEPTDLFRAMNQGNPGVKSLHYTENELSWLVRNANRDGKRLKE